MASNTVQFLPWSDEYSIGVRIIDNDHKTLFALVNALYAEVEEGTGTHEVDVLLSALSQYVDDHFEREEGLMKEYSYPDLAAHIKKHRELALDVRALKVAYINQPQRIDIQKLLEFLKSWLTIHILRSDMDYVPYLRGEARAVPEQDSSQPDPDPEGDLNKVVSITLDVPLACIEPLRRCASLLAAGGKEARDIESLIDSTSALTREEAELRARELLRG